jgi:hypothetical protein
MIAIINTGKRDAEGRHRYRLQINDKLIVEFTHMQRDGLAECLRLAAEAASAAHEEQIQSILDAATLNEWKSKL